MTTRIRRALKLWRRNLDVFREYYLASVIGNIGEPIIFLFGLGLGLGTMIEEVNGMSYLEFIAPGVMAVVAMNAAAFECTFSSYTRMVEQNIYEGILATPMSLEDIVLGEVMWGATKGVISSFAVLLVLIVAGIFHEYAAIPLIVINMAAIGAAISGIALCVSAVAKSYEFFNFFITLFIGPMILFTGV
ncbi:MAG: ABC transporter permease, partial [Nitrospinota bacterium]